MGNGALLGAGIWQWQRGTNVVAGEVSLHCNQSLQSAPKRASTLNLLNVLTDVKMYPCPSLTCNANFSGRILVLFRSPITPLGAQAVANVVEETAICSLRRLLQTRRNRFTSS